jgi:ATPase family associated with various cellular activities (AAA)
MTEQTAARTRDAQEASNANIVAYRVGSWDNQADLTFRREALGRLSHLARERVPAGSWSVEMLGDFKRFVAMGDGFEASDKAWLLRHDEDEITLVVVHDGWAMVFTASDDEGRARTLCSEVGEQIRAFERDESVTPITFWALEQHDRIPRPLWRKIATPSWEEVAGNYGEEATTGIGRLLELEDCPPERMILWHGPSGTGKTHALRALAREWSPWCDIAFISDPEEFIGGTGRYSPTYLFAVASFQGGHRAVDAANRSTLIVLEDAGELMAGEARKEAGQGLSRLLNVTDGLLGQGLKVMVLITTNEPIGTLHPAVTRPGRCLAEIEFGALSAERANEWLRRHDSEATVDGPTTLATLYATVGSRAPTLAASGSGTGRV